MVLTAVAAKGGYFGGSEKEERRQDAIGVHIHTCATSKDAAVESTAAQGGKSAPPQQHDCMETEKQGRDGIEAITCCMYREGHAAVTQSRIPFREYAWPQASMAMAAASSLLVELRLAVRLGSTPR